MGLDMYLKAKTYVSSYDEADKKVQTTVADLVKFPLGKLTGMEFEIAYWRKANAIHAWFVKNVQGGVDECQESYVPKEKLQQLYDLVTEALKVVKKDAQKAGALLPTAGGFFFGSIEYNEYYVEDLKDTQKQLKKILAADLKGFDIYYRASW